MSHHGGEPADVDGIPDPLVEHAQILYRQRLEEQRQAYSAGDRTKIDAEAARLDSELAIGLDDPLHMWEALDRLRDLAIIRSLDSDVMAELDRRAAEAAVALKREGITSMVGNPAGRLAEDLRRAASGG